MRPGSGVFEHNFLDGRRKSVEALLRGISAGIVIGVDRAE
jgi:hypothetical protein